MSAEITIDGKTYTAKLATLETLLRCEDIEKAMVKAREAKDYTLYRDLTVQRCELFLEGDVRDLASDRIAPSDMQELDSFFVKCLARNLKVSDGSNATSENSCSVPGGPTSLGVTS